MLSFIFMCVGMACFVKAWKWRPPKASTRVPDHVVAEDIVGEKYGHPKAPVSYLRRKLPSPPPDHGWEIRVVPDENGHLILRLALVDLAQGIDKAWTHANLTVRERWPYDDMNHTWAVHYAKYPSIGKDDFKTEVIQPLVDWAQQQVNKAIAGQPREYRLG